MPDKLTDNKIIKALECCSTYHDVSSCKNCPLDGKCEPNMLEQYALDLINRLQAENDRLNNRKNVYDFAEYRKNEIKAEAYKECIEKVKEIGRENYNEIIEEDLDNLLKELVGE